MIKIAILGFGKVGQTLLKKIQEDADFGKRFELAALWNRNSEVFEEFDVEGIKIYQDLEDLVQNLDGIDLVVECAHPSILIEHGPKILQRTSLFISSPTALADQDFREKIIAAMKMGQGQCYLPLGASVGVWDVIRLDQNQQIKSLSVSMAKHPDSFKIKEAPLVEKLEHARQHSGSFDIMVDEIAAINRIAPQNTNTMAIYALAAAELGFSACKGRIIADRDLNSHIVSLEVETKGGLKLRFERDNPAGHGAVTGSATFNSFLSSLYHYESGIRHNGFTFC